MSVNKFAAVCSSFVVLMSVAVGLFISGAPGEQRLKRLDKQRISDLRTIARAIDFYASDRNELPDVLAELVDGRRFARLPSDPATGIAYDYESVSTTRYRLCAQFDRSSNADIVDTFWAHGRGQKCYVFEVPSEE